MHASAGGAALIFEGSEEPGLSLSESSGAESSSSALSRGVPFASCPRAQAAQLQSHSHLHVHPDDITQQQPRHPVPAFARPRACSRRFRAFQPWRSHRLPLMSPSTPAPRLDEPPPSQPAAATAAAAAAAAPAGAAVAPAEQAAELAAQALEARHCGRIYATALQQLRRQYAPDAVGVQFASILEADETAAPSSVAQLAANSAKNRYRDVLPYDHNRVQLPPLQQEHSNPGGGSAAATTYINASFMGDPCLPSSTDSRAAPGYVATQGPLPATICDFW